MSIHIRWGAAAGFLRPPRLRGRVLEFEVKAPVPAGEEARVRDALGAARALLNQVDTYLAHPQRDFGATDEALRLRRVGERVELTYKGPKIDRETKARREVTLAVEGYDAARELLHALGFGLVADVRKTRSLHDFAGFDASFDEVEGLGAFVELERALPEGAPLDAARADARAALERLGLPTTERRSYLELLMEKGLVARR